MPRPAPRVRPRPLAPARRPARWSPPSAARRCRRAGSPSAPPSRRRRPAPAAAAPARAGGPRPGGDGAAARSADSAWSATTAARSDLPARRRARGPVPGRTGAGSSRGRPACRGCRRRWWGRRSCRGPVVGGEGNEQGGDLAGAGVDQVGRAQPSVSSARCARRGFADSHTASVAVSTSQPGASGPRSATACTRRRQSAFRCCSAAAQSPAVGTSAAAASSKATRRPLARTATCAWPGRRPRWWRGHGRARAAVKSARSVRGTSSSSPPRARSTQASSRAALLPCA